MGDENGINPLNARATFQPFHAVQQGATAGPMMHGGHSERVVVAVIER
jgi:hypothetical protein